MTKRQCGCGRTDGVREIVMSDRLWDQFFSTPEGNRPDTVMVCPGCIVDMQAFAGPLTEVPIKAPAPEWITQKTFPEPEPVEADPLYDLIMEIDTDLATLAKHERKETGDTKVADRATRRLIALGKALGYGKEEETG